MISIYADGMYSCSRNLRRWYTFFQKLGNDRADTNVLDKITDLSYKLKLDTNIQKKYRMNNL